MAASPPALAREAECGMPPSNRHARVQRVALQFTINTSLSPSRARRAEGSFLKHQPPAEPPPPCLRLLRDSSAALFIASSNSRFFRVSSRRRWDSSAALRIRSSSSAVGTLMKLPLSVILSLKLLNWLKSPDLSAVNQCVKFGKVLRGVTLLQEAFVAGWYMKQLATGRAVVYMPRRCVNLVLERELICVYSRHPS